MKCSEISCDKKSLAKGLCKAHYRKAFQIVNDREQKRAYRKTQKGKDLVSSWNKSEKSRISVGKYQKTFSARYSFSKYRAKKLELEWSIDKESYTKLISSPCFYCQGKLNEMGVGLDRKDSNKGYSIENVLPCCRNCNVLKMDMLTVEETIKLVALLKTLRHRHEWPNCDTIKQ